MLMTSEIDVRAFIWLEGGRTVHALFFLKKGEMHLLNQDGVRIMRRQGLTRFEMNEMIVALQKRISLGRI